MNSKKKVIIFCSSYHTLSTLKLCEGVAKDNQDFDIEVIHLEKDPEKAPTDVSFYDFVCFASGIYFGDYGKPTYKHLEKIADLKDKPCFGLSTSDAVKDSYNYCMKEKIEKKGGKYLGGFGTKGFVNMFPLNIFGGMNPGKPDQTCIDSAKKFLVENLK